MNQTELTRIVLTGGPSGGKSSAIRAFEEQYASQVYCTPEIATLLLSGGFPTPSEVNPWTRNWQNSFQRAVAHTQLGLEAVAEERALRDGQQAIVCDRGLLDGAAYLDGEVEELEELTGQTQAEMLGRYQAVIHLPTTALVAEYDRFSNPHRLEEAEEAIQLEAKTLEAWKAHPNRRIISEISKEARLQRVIGTVLSMLG